MNNLKIIEQNGVRVLTTAQLAESYGTDIRIISNNFTRNKERYKEGKHFIHLEGEALKQFKAIHQFDESLKFAPSLYLWTEKGAWLHAKSLNTDKAWDAYEMLVDEYYRLTKRVPQTVEDLIIMQAQSMKDVKQRLETVEKKQENITEVLSLNPTEWRKKVNGLINRIAKNRGGFDAYRDVRNESYQLLEERARCQLSIRLTNKRRKMALEGVPKSKIDKLTKMDAIADDARLTEIYLAIVKEMAIQSGVWVKEAVN